MNWTIYYFLIDAFSSTWRKDNQQMSGAGEGGGGEELTEKKSKQNRPPPKYPPIEMLSEFRGEHGSIGQDLLDRGEYKEAINFLTNL